ncbi:hypothetical protein ACMYR3_06030 [Ampullimonas aquatilis]|uniref:hypothetical protein n=1 Tax=Ampullimonas aquatilis TaxID=1341549 RepID=UPI003C779ADC
MELTPIEDSLLRTLKDARCEPDLSQFNRLIIELARDTQVRILNALELDYIRDNITPDIPDNSGIDEETTWQAMHLIKTDTGLLVLWIGHNYITCKECNGEGELTVYGMQRSKTIDCPWCGGEGTTNDHLPPNLLTDIDGKNPQQIIPDATLQ